MNLRLNSLRFVFLWMLMLLSSCAVFSSFGQSDLGDENPSENVKEKSKGKISTTVKAVPVKPLQPDPCMVYENIPSDPPFYVEDQGIVITRFLKPCVTRDGNRGYEKDTPWMAMGFPCTAGGGKISTKGPSYYRPKMASFILSTDCPMLPSSMESVAKIGHEEVGLPQAAKLVAYNPFAVQYWEIPGLKDADTGFTIDLRSDAAIEGIWTHFRQDEAVRVWLFGRENAWVQGDFIFKVEADIKKIGVKSFRLEVVNAKNLDQTEINEVKARCESLRPRRNCMDVF